MKGKTKSKINSLPNEKVLTFKNYLFPISDISIGITQPSSEFEIQHRILQKHHIMEYILDGEGEITINKKTFPLKKESTIILKSGTPHSITQKSDKPLSKLWISFSNSYYITYMLENYRLKSGVYQINNEQNFKNLVQLAKTQKDYSLLFFVANNIHEIITRTALLNKQIVETSAVSIKIKLDSLAYEKYSLTDIAKEMGMSFSSFSRIFRETYNISPGQYVINIKLEIAKSLLSSSNILIKNISNLLNFTDEYYFTHYFTKKVGLTPSEYRKQFQI